MKETHMAVARRLFEVVGPPFAFRGDGQYEVHLTLLGFQLREGDPRRIDQKVEELRVRPCDVRITMPLDVAKRLRAALDRAIEGRKDGEPLLEEGEV
jgi:hypothetical protein